MIRKDYHEKDTSSYLLQRRKKERELGTLRFKISLILLFLTISAWFWFIFYIPYFTIQNLDFTGTEKSLAEKINITLKGELDSHKIFVLNKSNYFIFDEVSFKQKLNEMFMLSDLEIIKKFPDAISIQAKEKTTSLVLLAYNKDGIYDAYYVDYHGMVIDILKDAERSYVPANSADRPDPDAPMTSSTSKIAISESIASQMPLVEVKNITNAINARTSVFNDSQVSTIMEIYDNLNKEGVAPDVFILEDLKDTKITIKTKIGFLIYMTTEDTVQNQIDNLKIILKEKIGEDKTKLQYIDLRFGDKVYIK
jgi:hypothetical protein